MEFDDLIESIYVGSQNNYTNNHFYIHLTKEELDVIKSVLSKNPIFEVARVRRYANYKDEVGFEKMKNIYIDFEKLNVENLFNYIFYVLKLNYRVDYLSFKDLLIALEILKENDVHINLHIFNLQSLNKEEQTLINNMLYINYNSMIMQMYVDDDFSLKSNVNSNGEVLESGIHYQVVEVKKPTYELKNVYTKPDILEKKASQKVNLLLNILSIF